MRTFTQTKALIAFMLLVSKGALLAHPQCNVHIMPSGRDEHLIPEYKEAINDFNQVARELGYGLPPHHDMYFTNSLELSRLATLDHHPLPHWIDGAEIFAQSKQVGGILEFVNRSPEVARSFYSDSLGPDEQKSIMLHVLGHNDFSIHSEYMQATPGDSVPASLECGEIIEQLASTPHRDAVQQYVTWLHSLTELQDMAYGTHTPYESFAHELAPEHQETDRLLLQGYPQIKLPTASVLQASPWLIASGQPKWKKRLMRCFSRMSQHYAGNIATKIINEGWATFSQYLIFTHTDWAKKAADPVHLQELLQAVTVPSLSNPYWLGLEIWKRHYQRFSKMYPHLQPMSLEHDKAFVTYAHQNIMLSQSSYDFIRYGLDQAWIDTYKLALFREATDAEIEAKCGQNANCYPQPGQRAMIILSRGAPRIRNHIARQQADFQKVFPKIQLRGIQQDQTVQLYHEVHEGIPLNLGESLQALFVYALSLSRPVAIETIYTTKDTLHAPMHLNVRVTPQGEVHLTSQNGAQPTLESLTQQAQQVLAHYKMDMDDTTPPQEYAFDHHFLHQLLRTNIDAKITDVEGAGIDRNFIPHAPTAARSISEYHKYLQRRSTQQLQKVLEGKVPVHHNGKKVRFRALPQVPRFSLDRHIALLLEQNKAKAPVDTRESAPTTPYVWGQDDAVQIAPLDYQAGFPGDIFMVPENEGGEGEGEGEEADESSEESDQDGQQKQPNVGDGSNAPGSIEMDLPDFVNLIYPNAELPYKRRVGGPNHEPAQRRASAINHDNGEAQWGRILEQLVPKSMAFQVEREGKIQVHPILEHIVNGIKNMTEEDIYVPNHIEHKKPTFRAAVVIAIDMSGSMSINGSGMSANKKAALFVKLLHGILSKTYEEIEFRYIAYDNEAYEFSEEQTFGKSPNFLGGGTSNVSGYQAAADILMQYPRSQWNRYFIGIGDAGASDGKETTSIIRPLLPQIEEFAYIYTSNGGYRDDHFMDAMKELTQSHENARYAELENGDLLEILMAIKKICSSYPEYQKMN
ncbi:MAG: SpoVR family protein [Zetaproteobacteria bacterium]|nr:SpoVR family protein [Zetaproteobacteria bacterium]